MRKLLSNIIILVFLNSLGLSQGVYVENVSIYSESNTLWYVEGDVELDNGGTIDNNGDIDFTQDWINNSGSTGLINLSPGRINMIGATQNISGNSVTNFTKLNLLGGLYDVKQAYQNVIVSDSLNIENAELQVHRYTVHLNNPNPNLLLWNNGFISGDSIGGYFSRSTNSTSNYRFPVGNSSLNNSVYRGVDIQPISSDSNVYGVRLAAQDASLDNTGTSFTGAAGPYDRLLKQTALLQLNDAFYHHIVRNYGTTSANVSLYFFDGDHPSLEDRFDGVAQWKKSAPRWEFNDAVYNENISGPFDLGTPNFSHQWLASNFNDDAFVLAVTEGILTFVPQIFSPNGDGTNDILFVEGRKIKELKFYIYNRWGEKVFETTDKEIGWDGFHRGKDSQSGVYVYYLEAEIEDYGPHKQKGNITLVR
jgi:gliding motility-associated-like protein